MLINRISESSLLIREGQKTLKSLQGEIKKNYRSTEKGKYEARGLVINQLAAGITESRTRGGARVYWRIRHGLIEILGISGKENQQRVINEILQCFGGQ